MAPTTHQSWPVHKCRCAFRQIKEFLTHGLIWMPYSLYVNFLLSAFGQIKEFLTHGLIWMPYSLYVNFLLSAFGQIKEFLRKNVYEMRGTARYYASYTKTMLPMRKSVPGPSRESTTRRPPDHRKETQTAVVWSCLLFIRSGQNHLARHSERRKKTRQTEEEVGRQHQGMERP